VAAVAAQARPAFDIYLIDVEGGNATLLVAPSGDSMLIDTGNGGAAADRDASRIMAAVTDAGLDRIDHLVTTHYHGDHFGAMEALAGRVRIGNFIDHGPTVQPGGPTDQFLNETYPALYAAARHTVVAPGTRILMGGIDARVVSSAGRVLTSPLPGAGARNPACEASPRQADDTGENAQSVGLHFTYGSFRAVHLGDLTWNTELDLMCPANRLGTVDLLVVSHHGQPSSNSPALVHALAPRAAIVNNGIRKGGQPEAMQVLFSTPRLQDIWQLHVSQLSGPEYSVPGLFIANLGPEPDEAAAAPPAAPTAPAGRGRGRGQFPTHDGSAFWIKASAREDGTFTVTNARNGFSKTYAAAR
jgi:beta-lactamase superfamily II metal-dependent hydrolase